MTKVINLYAGPGAGKCLAKGTKVISNDGTFISVENITTGMLLMGPDGLPRKVLGTTKNKGILYKIKTSKGEEFICNENHILPLKFKHHSVIGEVEHNIPVKDFLALSDFKKSRYKLYKPDCMSFFYKELPIDPYFLGFWLGDGLSAGPRISTERQEIIAYMHDFSKKFGDLHLVQHSYKEGTNCQTYGLSNTRKDNNNPLTDKLRDLKIINNKHIPNIYLLSSVNSRKKLLAGIIDSDGYKSNNGCYEVVTKLESLRDGYLFLARSLGYDARYSSKIVNGTTYYRVNINGVEDLPLLLEYKKSTKRQQVKNPLRYGFTVETIGDGEYYGFELSGDKLFLLDNFIVSHNSTTAAGIFYKMKTDLHSVELISEYAKQLTWEERHNILTNDQLYILAKQHRKMHILQGKVEYIITDSPLLLSLIYKPSGFPSSFDDLVWYLYNQFENINIFLPRIKPYVTVGRNQTEEQAKEIDLRVYEKFDQIYDFIPSRAEHHGPVVDQVYDYIKHGVE